MNKEANVWKCFHVTKDEEDAQLVLVVPQSKIGYGYPELWFCTHREKTNSLLYGYIDFAMGISGEMSEEAFLRVYTNCENDLTDEVLEYVGLNANLDYLVHMIHTAIKEADKA